VAGLIQNNPSEADNPQGLTIASTPAGLGGFNAQAKTKNGRCRNWPCQETAMGSPDLGHGEMRAISRWQVPLV